MSGTALVRSVKRVPESEWLQIRNKSEGGFFLRQCPLLSFELTACDCGSNLLNAAGLLVLS